MSQIAAGNILGGYRLVEQLGVGGMGEVWKAQNVRLGRMERAVKVIRVDVAELEEYRARFLREADLLEQLNHPNILHVFDLGEQDGVLYLTMELLHGKSIDQVMRQGLIPFDKIIDIGTQALTGLAHAHSLEIVHRDIKPANLFLQTDGVVKVLDFGIARGGTSASGALTGTGMAPGSPAYFAPEFADGTPATAASDVYSMGVSLFQMVTGRLPYDGGGSTPAAASVSLMIQHATRPFPDMRTLRPDIPEALVNAVMRSTAKKPEQRPTAAEMATMLSGQPVLVARPSAPVVAEPPAVPVPEGLPVIVGPGVTTLQPDKRASKAVANPMRRRAVGAAILVMALVAYLVGANIARARVRAILSATMPKATVGAIHMSGLSVVLEELHVPAPAGWSSADALSAKKITVSPGLFAMVRWRRLAAAVRVDGFFLAARKKADGTLEYLPGMLDGPKSGLSMAVTKLLFTDGVVELTDLGASPPAHARLSRVGGAVYDVLFPELDQASPFLLSAMLNDTGRVESKGDLATATRKGSVNTTTRYVDLVPLQPLMVRSSALSAGSLDSTSDLVLNGTHLTGNAELHMTKLEFAQGGSLFGVPSSLLRPVMSSELSLTVPVDLDLKDPRMTAVLGRAVVGAMKAKFIKAAGPDAAGAVNTAADSGSRIMNDAGKLLNGFLGKQPASK